jgi:hypothetical protein
MNRRLIGFCLLSLIACSDETDYDYKLVKDDSIYSNLADNRQKAMAMAEKKLIPYAKSACRRLISNGWFLSEIKDSGEMNCAETAEGHICRKKNLVLECRRVAEFFP